MKNTVLVLALAAIVGIVGCTAKSQGSSDSKTAMQKRYKSQAECRKEFPKEGDCVRHTSTGGTGGAFFMSPYFYPWGAIMHNNGLTSYNNSVPRSGYAPAPAAVQSRIAASRSVNFSKAPSSSGTVRGGFGGSSRGFSSGG